MILSRHPRHPRQNFDDSEAHEFLAIPGEVERAFKSTGLELGDYEQVVVDPDSKMEQEAWNTASCCDMRYGIYHGWIWMDMGYIMIYPGKIVADVHCVLRIFR